MSKVTWKHPTTEEEALVSGDDPKTTEMRSIATKLLPLANELAGVMEGNLLALFLDSRKEGTASVLVSVDDGASLNLVDVPLDATSLDDCPEEADHYCTALQLAEELRAAKAIAKDDGSDTLFTALMAHDRNQSFKQATRWMQIVIENGGLQPLPKPEIIPTEAPPTP